MRAIVQREFGPASVLRLEEVADPEPHAGEVLIEVEIGNITFIETQLRTGHAPHRSMLPELPTSPGNGVGGLVREVGPNGDPMLVGTRVIASTGGSGAYAEQPLAQAAATIEVPPGLSTPDAVALLADGRTALALMRSTAIQPGETVLSGGA